MLTVPPHGTQGTPAGPARPRPDLRKKFRHRTYVTCYRTAAPSVSAQPARQRHMHRRFHRKFLNYVRLPDNRMPPTTQSRVERSTSRRNHAPLSQRAQRQEQTWRRVQYTLVRKGCTSSKDHRIWAAMKWVSDWPPMAHAPQLATCATCTRSRALCGRFNEGLRGAQR